MSYSDDFRNCVLQNLSDGMTWQKVCEVFSVSRGSIAKWLKNKEERGVVCDRPRKLYKAKKIDPLLLKAAFDKTPDATLLEIAKQFNCWPQSIYKRCLKLGITRKKTTLYVERNEEKRQEFLAEIERIDPANLVWLDESGIDEFLQRDYARAVRGKQVISEVHGKKYGRISMIAGWLSWKKEIIAPYVFAGYTDSKRFNGWLKKCLLPELLPGQVVIMDNAAFHKSKLTLELIESVGCRLLFQPAYSPDLNPIEKQWATLKAKFKKYKHKFKTFNEAVDYAFTV